MILRYNPTPTSCLRSTVCVLHTNGRINTSPVAGRWVALTDSMPQERGTLLSSSHPRWRTNSTRVKDLAWAKETSSGLPGVREKRRKEKKIPTTGSRHFSAVHFALAQDKSSLDSVPLSLCGPTTDVTHLLHTGRISRFEVFVCRP